MSRPLLLLGLAFVAFSLLGVALWLYAPDRLRGALEARYAGPPSTFRDVLGLRVHLRDTGPRDAPALLLLHGFGASLHTWDGWASALEAEYRVIRLDLPGFGLTGADPSGDYTDARTTAVLAALLDSLGVARATLVGNSMGGRFAWRFAAAHPERVEGLVLISPDGFASPGRAYDVQPRVPPLLRLLPYTLPLPLLRRQLAASYGDPALLTEDVIRQYADLLRAPGVRRAILDRTGQERRQDPRPTLARTAAPTLLLWGERDRLIPFSHAADWQAALPHAQLVSFPELGHVPQEEAPARSVAPLHAFLGR